MKLYWLEQNLNDLPRHNQWLSPNEVVHLNGLRFAKRCDDWRLGRWTVKQAVSISLHLPGDFSELSRIEVRPASSGAPEVFYRYQPVPVAVSLSHRSGMAACCVAWPGKDVGCDLEAVEPRSDGFLNDYFTEDEQGLVGAAPLAQRAGLVTLLWSAKESALKALRTGLRLDTRSVTVHVDFSSFLEAHWAPLEVCYGQQLLQGWWQGSNGFVRTVVGNPPLDPPTLLISAHVSGNSIAASGSTDVLQRTA